MDDAAMDDNATITKSSQHSTDSDQPSNAAQSLREAALLTLKSKRSSRKPVDSLPARPMAIPTSTFLDYGQEETPTAPVKPAEITTPSTTTTTLPEEGPHDNSSDVEDGQIREEGEISDSETTPVSLPRPLDPDPPPVLQRSNVKSEPTTPKLFILPKASQPAPRLIINSVPVDADHVRPGLALNQTQYDTAKDIVLDLLGWAVPPEYLLNCGLSREIIFYVFSELNLRLPENLDVTGLVPFPPISHPASPKSPTRPQLPPASPDLPRRPELGTIDTTSPTLVGHPSLPAKPIITKSPTFPARPLSPSAPVSPSPASTLQDMEKQRRQELQARKKAVQDSRKSKSTSSQDSDIMMLTPSAFVDDFLKSIESSDTPMENASQEPVLIARVSSPEAMEVDQGIQAEGGYSIAYSSTPSLGTESVPPSTASSAISEESASSSSDSLTLDLKEFSPPLTDIETSRTTFARTRGTKRPVAADFVDFESGPSPVVSSNGYTNGGLSQPNPLTRRKTGNGSSFASVSGMRRCVIDLSDSEGEGESASQLRVNTNPTHRTQSPGRFLAPLSATTPGWVTPVSSTQGPDTMSPAALLEKEEEIRRMKAQIERKEQQSRYRKLLSATRSMSNANMEIPTVAITPSSPDVNIPGQPLETLIHSNGDAISNHQEALSEIVDVKVVGSAATTTPTGSLSRSPRPPSCG